MMVTDFTYIATQDGLQKAKKEWDSCEVLGIDLECENNLHHFGAYISLIQISSEHRNWIVDVIKLKEIKPLLQVLQNKKIIKIFHDVSFDFRILNLQFQATPKNVFDSQLGALLIGETEVGLGSLLEKFFSVQKERKFQMADWTARPLKSDMLEYATKDTVYLIKLKNLIDKELKRRGRTEWARQEFEYLDKRDWPYEEGTYLDVKGAKSLEPRSLALFKRLYKLRRQLARKVDRPVHFIMNSKKLVELSGNPPLTFLGWKTLRGVHPIVKSRAKLFDEAVKLSKNETVFIPKVVPKRFTPEKREELEKLEVLRDKVATKIDLQRYLILSQEQMRDMVASGNTNSLRKWQKEVLGL